ncbi:MAG: MobA/MobL family protein [Rhodospirillales bacterium]|jgi:hypothetical protein|nr:MobA/MobL family protein [Rhodospirillales bacterium]
MAIYRCELKVYGRGKAQSAVAASAYVTGTRQTKRGGNSGKVKLVSAVEAAAYRSSQALGDERAGVTHDYTGKENVVWSGILAPDNAPAWVYDRGRLWNAVERAEKRKDAQLFREALLTIPRELNAQQRIALVRAFVRDQFVGRGMIADIGLHNPHASDGMDQPHAHVMLTLRDIGPEGFGKKRTDWNEVQWAKAGGGNTARKDGFLKQLRQAWQNYCNAALEEAGSEARVDHRSLKARGIDRQPQPKIGKAKYAKPAPWVAGIKDRALDVWAHNRAVQVGRAANRAYLKGSHVRAAEIAIEALNDDGDRTTATVVGHGPSRPDPDIWGRSGGYDVG